jgi:hypothetical protein
VGLRNPRKQVVIYNFAGMRAVFSTALSIESLGVERFQGFFIAKNPGPLGASSRIPERVRWLGHTKENPLTKRAGPGEHPVHNLSILHPYSIGS